MKKTFFLTLLSITLSFPAFAADMKERDVKNVYMRYCTMNGGVKEICDCSYQEAQQSIPPKDLEAIVKTLSAGVPSNERVLFKMNSLVQLCARKVQTGELKINRPVPAPIPAAPTPPTVPMPDSGAALPPPPPPPLA